MIEEEEAFKDICVTLILDFCREILSDRLEVDEITISKVNDFCEIWIDENFGKDQTVIDEPNLSNLNHCVYISPTLAE